MSWFIQYSINHYQDTTVYVAQKNIEIAIKFTTHINIA